MCSKRVSPAAPAVGNSVTSTVITLAPVCVSKDKEGWGQLHDGSRTARRLSRARWSEDDRCKQSDHLESIGKQMGELCEPPLLVTLPRDRV